ncbi:MAG: MBL fold metallo-hydrolase [Rhodospirillales bacterium]|nr:MBL fold metallo-hydrolase [Rhodospirillales bacterium]
MPANDFRVAILPVTPLQQNCLLLWVEATRQAVVVDPGGDAPAIMHGIDQLGLSVEALWLTHGHLDHAGGAKALRAALRERQGTDLPLLGPDPRDRFLLEHIEEAAQRFGLSGMENVLPDRWLAEGEKLALGPLVFDVLHCPGHTPGHVVFVEKARRFAIVGDVLFRGSVGRTDFPYGDHAALIAAIRDKLLPLGDDIAFLCGHGEGSTFGIERRSNPFLQDDAHAP